MDQFSQITKNKALKLAFKGAVLFLLIFSMAKISFADYSQLDHSTQYTTTQNVELGTGLYGSFSTIDLYVNRSGTPPLNGPALTILSFTDSSYTTGQATVLNVPATDTTTTIGVLSYTGLGNITFDSSLYYLMIIFATASNKIYGSAIMPYYHIYTGQDNQNYNTRIISTIPNNNQTISSSTNATIGGSLYINDNDYSDNMVYHIKYGLKNTNYQLTVLDAWESVSSDITIDFPITNSGYNYFSTTTDLSNIGEYYMNSYLDKTYLFGFLKTTITSTSTNFLVSTSSVLDIYFDNQKTAINNLIASTTNPITESCKIANFDLVKCIMGFAFPTNFETQVKPLLLDFYNGTLKKVPFGYPARLYEIMSATSTSNLPTADLTFPAGDLMGGTPYVVDPNEILTETKTLMDDIKTPTGDNIEDIFKPIAQIVLALVMLYLMIRDII